MKELWDRYSVATDRLEDLEGHVKSAKQEVSDTVKALLDANNGSKLITRDGVLYTIMQREGTYYLRTGKAGRPPKKTTLRDD